MLLMLSVMTSASYRSGASAGHEKKRNVSCAVNCMDFRVQKPVNDYAERHWGEPDEITEAGPSKILAENAEEKKAIVENIRYRVDISVNDHHAKVIILVAHNDCRGSKGDKSQQIKDLRESKRRVEAWGYKVPIKLLWVNVEKNPPTVEEIK